MVKIFWHGSKSIFYVENWAPVVTGSGLIRFLVKTYVQYKQNVRK